MEMMFRAARNPIGSVALVALLLAPFSVPAVAQMDLQQNVTAIQAGEAAKMAKTSLLGAVSGASIPTQGPTMVPPHFADLKLSRGFLLSLNVLDDPDFTGTFRVDDSGNVVLPVLGSIHVAGETAPQARDEITKGLLDRGILKNPQVELDVVQYTAPQVTILGAVSTPGVFPLLAPEGLGDVLALAGDTTILAGDRIEITNPNSGEEPKTVPYTRGTDPKLLDSITIQPGDTVQVTQAGVVYVLGAVNRPGGFVMQENGNLSILQAVSIAGGTGITASIKSVYVLRRNKDNTTTWLEFPFKKMTEGKFADAQLQLNDILFVPTNHFKAAYLSTSNVLASASSASIISAYRF